MTNLFSFSGRAGRAEWWLVSSICSIYSLGMAYRQGRKLVDDFAYPDRAAQSLSDLGGGLASTLLFAAISIVVFWISLAVTVRRCHDRNKSSWFFLVVLVPLLNFWYMVEICFLPGTPGPNRFGPPSGPLGGGHASHDDSNPYDAHAMIARAHAARREMDAPRYPAAPRHPSPAGNLPPARAAQAPAGFGKRGLRPA